MVGKPRGAFLSFIFLAAVLHVPCAALAEVTIADPGTFVVDDAGLVDAATKDRIEKYLKELEQKTTAQVKVLTVKTTGDEDIVPFAQRHFVLWKLGQKGKDNGALVVLDLGHRRVRVHTGYGLEGPLPDSWCGTLSRKVRDQFFRAGQYSQGLETMAVSIANKVADDAGVKLTGVPDIRHRAPENDQIIFWIVIIVVVLFVIFNARRNARHRRAWRGGYNDSMLWGATLNDLLRGGGGPGRSNWSGGYSDYGGSFGGGFDSGGGSFGGGGDSGGGGGGASW